MARIAVIGLGLMGGALAANLMEEGHTVVGYDPEGARRAEHSARGGEVATSESEAVAPCEFALLSLPNGAIMREVCDRITATGPPGLLVMDTTTADPGDSIDAAAALGEAAIGYVDATVSGNAAQGARRDIIFMIGGPDDLAATAGAILEPLGRAVYHVGEVGAGSQVKLVVNHILSINRTAVAEGLAVAEKAGLDLATVLDVLRDGAAYSKAMDIWGDRMVSGDHWPPASRVRQSHKDSRLINAHAERVGASRALVAVVREALIEAEEGGLSDADNSSVMEVMRRRAGIGRYEAGR